MPSAAVEQRRSEPFLDRTTVSAIDIILELEGAAQHRLAPLGRRRPNRPTLHADPHRNFALRKAGLAEVIAIISPVSALRHLAAASWSLLIKPVSRSEEHTSELQSLMRISYAVLCLQKKKKNQTHLHRMKKKN